MESDRSSSWEEVRNWHREWLAEELPRLGPTRFIEGLRIVRQSRIENVTANRVPEMFREHGFELKDDMVMHFEVGYIADRDQWDEILGLLERE